MERSIFRAIYVEYAGSPAITVSVDGKELVTQQLAAQDSFRGRRVTLPVSSEAVVNNGFVAHLECSSTQLQNYSFQPEPILSYATQQLFHYYEIGYRGTGLSAKPIVLHAHLDGTQQDQVITITDNSSQVDTVRLYFNKLAYGFLPHIHNAQAAATDGEILWARPVALPPRFYRGIRSHAEFQITYSGDVTIQWYLDGVPLGDPYVLPTVTTTTTEKMYFQAGTIGHVLQYRVTNPTAGRVYVVETDVTLSDLEQQTMTQNTEERV